MRNHGAEAGRRREAALIAEAFLAEMQKLARKERMALEFPEYKPIAGFRLAQEAL